MRACVLLVAAGCWTGPTPADPAEPRAEPPPSAFEITMQRTPCLGSCPAYTVSVDGDGRVKWHGESNVEAAGDRRATVLPRRVKEIERMLDEVRFFERDRNGEMPNPGVVCEQTGPNSSSCSFSSSTTICSDTSHAVVTVRRGTRKHTVDNAHCEMSTLDRLESLIDEVARTSAWIGTRVTF